MRTALLRRALVLAPMLENKISAAIGYLLADSLASAFRLDLIHLPGPLASGDVSSDAGGYTACRPLV